MCYRHESQLVHSSMAPSDARRIVRRMCHELHVEDLTDTAALLTSELVTNAVRHAPGPLHIGVGCAHGSFVVSVQDGDPEGPNPRRAQARSVGGRGLALVNKLADSWGYRQIPNDGKQVWFALRPATVRMDEATCRCPQPGDGSAAAPPPIQAGPPPQVAIQRSAES
jgi:anti-sigma regulatory factor (Ser/Thr protein kinase)